MAIEITNQDGDRPTLWLYDDIGGLFAGVTADDFRRDLASVGDEAPIDLRINSGGGIYTEGIAIHTLLRNRPGPVNVFVDGLAASAASLVAMAGETIEMAQGSWMMIHEAQAFGGGKAADLRAMADRLDQTNSQIVALYGARYRGSEDELRAALDAETWLTESDAVESGLADSVAQGMAVAARVDPEKYKYAAAPKALVEGTLPRLREREAVVETMLDIPTPSA